MDKESYEKFVKASHSKDLIQWANNREDIISSFLSVIKDQSKAVTGLDNFIKQIDDSVEKEEVLRPDQIQHISKTLCKLQKRQSEGLRQATMACLVYVSHGSFQGDCQKGAIKMGYEAADLLKDILEKKKGGN